MRMKKSATVFLGLMSLSVGAERLALAGVYDGPAVDVNFINQKPAQYAECDQYKTLPEYKACDFARDEAERMATRFGGGNGRIQGYLRGFSWGLYKTTKASQNDGTEMARGAAAIDGTGDYQSKIQSGLQQGIADGQTRGASQGKSDAIARFSEAMDTGRTPNRTIKIPTVDYAGPQVGYEQLVGKPKTVADVLQQDINEDLGHLRVYDSWDETYLGERKPLTLQQLWFDNGTYVFQKEAWFDPNLAFQTWLQRPIDTRPKYNSLNQDAPAPAPGAPAVDLQAVFRKSFVNCYSYYVNYYFSQTFFQNMDDGQVAGEMVGTQVGKRLAFEAGLVQAFNKRFQESARTTFYAAYNDAYTSSFNTNFDDYLNNPKIAVEFTGVVGESNMGIIQPGERITPVFTVRNYGGARTSTLR